MAEGGVLGEAASMRTHGKRNGRALSERNRRLSSRANTVADAADIVAVARVAPPTHPREPPLTPEATPLCVSEAGAVWSVPQRLAAPTRSARRRRPRQTPRPLLCSSSCSQVARVSLTEPCGIIGKQASGGACEWCEEGDTRHPRRARCPPFIYRAQSTGERGAGRT